MRIVTRRIARVTALLAMLGGCVTDPGGEYPPAGSAAEPATVRVSISGATAQLLSPEGRGVLTLARDGAGTLRKLIFRPGRGDAHSLDGGRYRIAAIGPGGECIAPASAPQPLEVDIRVHGWAGLAHLTTNGAAAGTCRLPADGAVAQALPKGVMTADAVAVRILTTIVMMPAFLIMLL